MRTLFIIVWTGLISIICSTATILASLMNESDDVLHKIVKVWARSILAVSRIKVTVKGLSKIDPAGHYIYMSNHQSNFDIPALISCLPVHFRWIAKAELFKIPIFGYAMKKAGHISIDRSNRKSAFKSLKNAANIIKNGTSVLIFPEGTRSLDGSIGSFKNGGFILAVDSGVSIVPVIIHGTWPIMPKDRILIKPGNVTLEIRQPVKTSNYTRKTKDDLMKKIRQIICESFEREKRK